MDGDEELDVLGEHRDDEDVVEEGGDDGYDPWWSFDFFEHSKDEVVVDGVEGLGGVKEEDIVLLFALDSRVEPLIESADMVRSAAARDEALLLKGNDVGERWGDDDCNNFGNDAIVRVVDSDWAGAVNGDRVGLGDDEEATMVKPIRREVSLGEIVDDVVEDGGCDIMEETISGEGDSVRSWRRVVGMEDAILHLGNSWELGEEIVGYRFGVVGEVVEGGLHGGAVWALGPDGGPKVGDDGGHGAGLGGGAGVGCFLSRWGEGSKALAGRGKQRLDVIENMLGVGASRINRHRPEGYGLRVREGRGGGLCFGLGFAELLLKVIRD